jgi:hypothetical protein
MDTSILHDRIKEYKEKAKNPASKEMILLFETWFLSIENYISDIELNYFEAQVKITELKKIISNLCDIIILSGQSDKIDFITNNDPSIKKAIELLLKSKDRKNYNSIIAISALLDIYPEIEFKNLQQLKDHASR